MALTLQTGRKLCISCLSQEEFDLSTYREKLDRLRDERSLLLRRIHLPCISHYTSNSSTVPIATMTEYPALDPDYLIPIFAARNENDILSLPILDQMAQPGAAAVLNNLAINEEFAKNIMEALNDDINVKVNNLIMAIIEKLYPHSTEEIMEQYIDDGLAFTIYNFLSTKEHFEQCISLMVVIATNCTYARDALTCIGTHSLLLEIVLSISAVEIIELCLEALYAFFRNDGSMDPANIDECINPLFTILHSTDSTEIIKIICSIFCEMTNKLPIVADKLFNQGLYELIMEFLPNPNYTEVAIFLIGNVCATDPEHIGFLIDRGLMEHLMNNLNNAEMQSTVLWVCSNIMESGPHLILPHISNDIMKEIVTLANESPFNVKKEAAFFIGTVILHIESHQLPMFLNQDVMDILEEMLTFGISEIVIRCIDAMLRLLIFMPSERIEELIQIILNSDIHELLEQIIQENISVASDRAKCIIHRIDRLTRAD